MKKLIVGMCVVAGSISCGPMDAELACDPNPAAATLATNVQAVFSSKCGQTCHLADDLFGDYTDAAKIGMIVNKKSLYAGMGAKMSQTVLNSAFMFSVYEGLVRAMLRFLQWLSSDR